MNSQSPSIILSELADLKHTLDEIPQLLKSATERIKMLDGFVMNYLSLYESMYKAGVEFTPEQKRQFLDCARFMWKESKSFTH
jgi:uncharacterized membrane-anchored protein YhcB (DUF1043 family)